MCSSDLGMPAKVKRALTDEEVANLASYWQNYVEYSRAYLAELDRGSS